MNKKKMGAWVTALFVAAAMVLPVGKALAAEGNKPGILLGGQGLEGKGVSHVYLGEHDGEPIETRVLAKEGNHLVVLSEYILERVPFDSAAPYGNNWATSNAKQWCAGVYDGFTAEEQAAIPAITKAEEGPYTINGLEYKDSQLVGEHLYFLTAKEAVNPDYGFAETGGSHDSRVAYHKGDKTQADWWWLRSAYTVSPTGAGAVSHSGNVNWGIPRYVGGGRPAFQIDLDAVLFASAAVDGKRSGTVGAEALKAIENNGTNDWKLTLKEGADKRPFAVTDQNCQTVSVGNTVLLDYTGAVTDTNEYVSAMLVDSSNQPVYYGRIKQVEEASEATGSVEIAIPENLPLGDYTLQVFNEQYNGDKETDYASVPSVVPLTVVRKPVEPKVEDGKLEGLLGTVTQGEKVTFTAQGAGMDNLNPVAGDERFRPKSWSVNPRGDFVGDEYTQSFETAGMTPGEHTLVITYAQERFDGSVWVDTDERETQSFPFTLLAAPPQGGGERSAATPGELTGENPGTGDSVRIGWLVAAGVAALGAAAGLVRQRRKA